MSDNQKISPSVLIHRNNAMKLNSTLGLVENGSSFMIQQQSAEYHQAVKSSSSQLFTGFHMKETSAHSVRLLEENM